MPVAIFPLVYEPAATRRAWRTKVGTFPTLNLHSILPFLNGREA